MYVALFAKSSNPTNKGIRMHQNQPAKFCLFNAHAPTPEFHSSGCGAQ